MNSKLNELCKSLYRVCVSRLVTHLLRYSLTLTTLFIWNIHTALHCTYTGYLAVGHTLYYCSALAYNMLPLTECSLSLSEHDAHNSSAADALQALYTSPYPSHTHLLPLLYALLPTSATASSAPLFRFLLLFLVLLLASFLYRSLEIMCVEALPLTFCTIADIACCCMLLYVVACCCMPRTAQRKGKTTRWEKTWQFYAHSRGVKGKI